MKTGEKFGPFIKSGVVYVFDNTGQAKACNVNVSGLLSYSLV